MPETKITYRLAHSPLHERVVLVERAHYEVPGSPPTVTCRPLAAKDIDGPWERLAAGINEGAKAYPQIFGDFTEISKAKAVAIMLAAKIIRD
jgi:hypothetical protein